MGDVPVPEHVRARLRDPDEQVFLRAVAASAAAVEAVPLYWNCWVASGTESTGLRDDENFAAAVTRFSAVPHWRE